MSKKPTGFRGTKIEVNPIPAMDKELVSRFGNRQTKSDYNKGFQGTCSKMNWVGEYCETKFYCGCGCYKKDHIVRGSDDGSTINRQWCPVCEFACEWAIPITNWSDRRAKKKKR